MFMTAIDLVTEGLSNERVFYSETLGLPLRQASADAFTVQAGTTALTFRASREQGLLYHVAFTISQSSWEQARTWLKARTTLLEGEGQDEFESARARTCSYYFPDAAGTILELISREDLPAKPAAEFGPEEVL